MTKAEMIDAVLTAMKSDRQRAEFKKRGMRKTKEYITRLYNAWMDDKKNTTFYIQLINA